MRSRSLMLLALAAALASCSSGPTPPAWQADARQAIEDAQAAYLEGDSAAEARHFARARSEVARTGRPALMARVELMRCAAHAASLVFEPCTGYEAVASDAEPAEKAYAAWLAGKAGTPELALLPENQRALARASGDAASALAALQAEPQPLSRLLGAALMLQAGRASPAIASLAVDTASEQGWRRPLLAWLQVQRERARQAGDEAEAARLQRRMDLVLGPSAAATR